MTAQIFFFTGQTTKTPQAHKQAATMNFPYVYHWLNQGRKGQFCRVTARGKMNSIRLEFEDGYTMITSGNSIRKRKTS
jgi:hypothetical protein